MSPKVSKVGSRSTKTIVKASTSSSSKSSGSSKTSSSSSVKKTTPPVTSKPKNVDKVDFGLPKPPKVTYDAPQIKNVLATKKVAIAEVTQTKTKTSSTAGTSRTQTTQVTNEFDLPMKSQKDLKPDGAHHFLEHKNEMMDKVQAPEIARKIEAMSDLSAVIPVANREFNNLAVPSQNFCDACDAIEDFANNSTIEQLIKDTIGWKDVSDGFILLKAASKNLKSTVSDSISAAGAEVAKGLVVSRVVGLLQTISEKIIEAKTLKENLQSTYSELVRATDKFNLRNSEIFELCERAGAKNTDMKYIVYPTTLAKIKSTFGI